MKSFPFPARAVLFCSLLLAMPGCAGYQLGFIKPTSLANIESIAIPTFKNETLEPRTSVLVTNAVIKRFHEDGTYQIKNEENADAVLRGTFIAIDRSQLRAVATDQLQTSELRVRLAVDYALIDTHTNKVLERGIVYGDTDLFLDQNYQLSERQAFPLAADEVAGQLVSKLSEGW